MRSTTMESGTRTRLGDGLYVAFLTFAVVVALPLVIVALFFARVAMVFAVVGALTAAVLAYAFSRRFRGWLQYVGEDVVPYKGLQLATSVALAPGHVWARVSGAEAEIGADDVMQAALGPVDRVELPEVGRHVRSGERLFRLHHEDRSLDGPSPVTGTVVAVNRALADEPGRVNVVPFTGGWTVRVAADDMPRERHGLRRGMEARELFRREVDRLLSVCADSEGLPALADGGEVVHGLHRRIDDRTWKRVRKAIFAEPADHVVA